MGKDIPKPDYIENHPTEAEIDSTLEETFPASDPPGWTLGIEQTNALIEEHQPSNVPTPLETLIVTRTRDLVGGFKVRRALPSTKRRMVGPFIFLDQMGPEVFKIGAGLDVAPHPHIGLA